MRKVIKKWFWVWEFGDEEKWLNQMANDGYELVDVGFGRYTFDACEKGEYSYKLELLDHYPTSQKSQDYISFIEETGANYIGHVSRWAYFKKKSDDGDFDLFSDYESRVKHMNRMLSLLTIIFVANFLVACGNMTTYIASKAHISMFCVGLGVIMCLFIGIGMFKVLGKKMQLKSESELYE